MYVPRTQMTPIFEGQPPKTRPFPIKTGVIRVPGMYISHLLPCNLYTIYIVYTYVYQEYTQRHTHLFKLIMCISSYLWLLTCIHTNQWWFSIIKQRCNFAVAVCEWSHSRPIHRWVWTNTTPEPCKKHIYIGNHIIIFPSIWLYKL